MEVAEEKAAIRRRLGAQRRGLDKAWVEATSLALQARVIARREFAGARAVGCYLSVGGEVGTAEIVRRCRQEGKRLCVPARTMPDAAYALCWLDEDAPLARGPMGIPEPAAKRWAMPGEVDVIVVPGVAFDVQGNRLGHGGGHYDRLLAALARGPAEPLKVGVAFDFQIVDRLPTGETDVGMDVVITETRTMRRASDAV